MPHHGELVKRVSARWDVSSRTVQRWLKRDWPVHDEVALARAILASKRPATRLMGKAQDILRQAEVKSAPMGSGQGSPGKITPSDESDVPAARGDEREGDTSHSAGGKVEGAALDMDNLIQDFSERLAWAQENSRLDLIRIFSDEVRKTLKLKSDQEMHARKMGLDLSETVSRDKFVHLVRVLAFWLLRGADQDARALGPQLLKLDFVEEVERVLVDHYAQQRILVPFVKMAGQAEPLGLPEYVVDALRSGVREFVEAGAEDFDARLKREAEVLADA